MHITERLWIPLVAGCALSGTTPPLLAAPTFFGPTPYLSASDVPTGFYLGDTPAALETFEDGVLDFGITASVGWVPGSGGLTDSVDADDGAIDGSGTNGRSWYSNSGRNGIVFTFSGTLPTAAGMVWTDGAGTTTFEAFGPGMVSLGTIGPVAIADGTYSGTTAEDRFFGVHDSAGILAIKMSNSSGGIEVDHVQFGVKPIPEPGTPLLWLAGLGLLGGVLHRKRRIDT